MNAEESDQSCVTEYFQSTHLVSNCNLVTPRLVYSTRTHIAHFNIRSVHGTADDDSLCLPIFPSLLSFTDSATESVTDSAIDSATNSNMRVATRRSGLLANALQDMISQTRSATTDHRPATSDSPAALTTNAVMNFCSLSGGAAFLSRFFGQPVCNVESLLLLEVVRCFLMRAGTGAGCASSSSDEIVIIEAFAFS